MHFLRTSLSTKVQELSQKFSTLYHPLPLYWRLIGDDSLSILMHLLALGCCVSSKYVSA